MAKKSSRLAPRGIEDTTNDTFSMSNTMSVGSQWMSGKRIALIVLLIGLAILAFTNKGLFLAAVVNGKPVFRFELNNVMAARFGKQTLEQMISERLISDAAAKEGVSVTRADMDVKIAEITKSLGDPTKLEQLLAAQGMTKSEFENQIQLQLLVQKLLGRDVVISEGDIDNFIATNRALLVATDPAKLREEARQAIMDSKVGEKLQDWFGKLKDSAKILRFL